MKMMCCNIYYNLIETTSIAMDIEHKMVHKFVLHREYWHYY